ncbi:MAG: hypothetical protein M3290_04345 [Actinomycetota bacterium]|nr:hypothetical protein [Actinomycetota bacterium]
MRLSDLLDAEVVDLNLQPIGKVHEVRAVKDGPIQGAFGAGLRLDGLVVGRTSVGTRLGLDRSDTGRPAALRWIFTRIAGDKRYVPWDRVVAVTSGRIVITGDADDLRPPETLSSMEQVDTPATE